MCERVIADLVPFSDDSFDESRICLPILADDKERRLDILPFQNIEDLRRPDRDPGRRRRSKRFCPACRRSRWITYDDGMLLIDLAGDMAIRVRF